jgi:hypothetical protein
LQPLDGITVAPPGVNLPGPLAASRLAEFDASAPKVESPAGDPPLHACIGRCLNTPLRAPARPSGTGYEGDAGMLGGAFPGCRIQESADGHVALSGVEPHFFERAPRACGVDGCRVAIGGALAARPQVDWKPLPPRQISPELGAAEVAVVDFGVSVAARHCAGQPVISPTRPASSSYRRVTRCRAVRARLPGSGRQGEEIGSDGNSNARRCEVVRTGVRRGRLSGATAPRIAALNSTAGSSFGDPGGPRPTRQAGRRRMKPAENGCTATVPRSTFASSQGNRLASTPGQQALGRRPRPLPLICRKRV